MKNKSDCHFSIPDITKYFKYYNRGRGRGGGEGKAVWGGEGRAEALPIFESSSTLMVFIEFTKFCQLNTVQSTFITSQPSVRHYTQSSE